MSATYNWAYRPGVTNKYGFTVPTGADNTRPTGWCYVALFGNDTTGNGSRQYPFRTITKASSIATLGTFIVLGSGVYREATPITGSITFILVGDGDVTIDLNYIGNLTTAVNQCPGCYNIKVIGTGTSTLAGVTTFFTNSSCVDCYFNGASPSVSGFYGSPNVSNNIFTNVYNILGDGTSTKYSNCTFNCTKAYFPNDATVYFTQCIFVGCNISGFSNCFSKSNYTLFYQCNFNFTGSKLGGVTYPSVPTGYSYYSNIIDLQSAGLTAYSTPIFNGCIIADPVFNNSNIGDYSLSFSSPAKNLSYFGTYVGARSIAYPIKANSTESAGTFDFSTNVNLTVGNDSIALIDVTQNGSIKTKMIVNMTGRQIQRFPIYGFNADRNGQYIDSISDLDTNVRNAGDTLTIPASYLVETGAITYNSVPYQPGDRLTTIAGQTTFNTSVSGTLREILEAPERHTIMARFSDGGSSINAGDALIENYWYYVVTGSATYNSITYNAGSGFKAVDTNPFTGLGSVILALSNQSFQHYEPGIQPTSNNTGDSRTGAIIRGNGDPNYVRGGYGIQEFPINSKFIQLYYIINVSNLKP